MILEIINELWQNKKVRYAFLFVLVLVLAVYIFSILFKTTFTQHYVTKTELDNSKSYSYLDGSKILAYNGLTFYKVDLASENKISTLSGGQKLPTPEAIFWAGEKGALMTFKSSFTYTLVEEELKKVGKKVDLETRNYVWYFDFASSKLSLVSERNIYSKVAAFSKKDNGFYLATEGSKGDSKNTPILFYDLSTAKTVVEETGYGEVLRMFVCKEEGGVCIVSRDKNSLGKQVVQRIDRNGQKNTVYEVDGQVFGSSNPNYLLVAKTPPDDIEKKKNERDEGGVFQGAATLVNLSTSKETGLNFETEGSSLIGNIPSEGNFYVIDTMLASTKGKKDIETATYTSGRINDKSIKIGVNNLLAADSSNWVEGVINVPSYGENGLTLLVDYNGFSIVVSPDKGISPIPLSKTEDIKKLVGNCIKSSGLSDYQFFEDSKTFRILAIESPAWRQQINSFTDCINSSGDSAMYGYNYQISLRDARNGRLISD